MSTMELRARDGGDATFGRRTSPRTAQPLYRPPGQRRAAEATEAEAAADRRPPRQLYIPPRGRRHGLNRPSSPGFSTCSEIVTSWRTASDAGPARPPPGPRRRISQQTRRHVEELTESSGRQEEALQTGRPLADSRQTGLTDSHQSLGSPGDSPGKRPGRRRRRGGRRSRSRSEDRAAAASPSFQVPTFPLSPTATAPRPAHVPWRPNAASGRLTPTPEREATRPSPARPRFQQPYQPPAARDRPASAAANVPSSPPPHRGRVARDSPQRQGHRGHEPQRGYAPRDSPQRNGYHGNGGQDWPQRQERGGYYSPPGQGQRAQFSPQGRAETGRWRDQPGQASTRPPQHQSEVSRVSPRENTARHSRPALYLDLSDARASESQTRGERRPPADVETPGAVSRLQSGGSQRSPLRRPPGTPPSPRLSGDSVEPESEPSPSFPARRDSASQRPAPDPPAAAELAAPPASDPAGPSTRARGVSGSEEVAVGGAGAEAVLPGGPYDHLVNTTDDEKASLSARVAGDVTEEKAAAAVSSCVLSDRHDSEDRVREDSAAGGQFGAKDEDSVGCGTRERAANCEDVEPQNGQPSLSGGLAMHVENATAIEGEDICSAIVQTARTNDSHVSETSSCPPTPSEVHPDGGAEAESAAPSCDQSEPAGTLPLRADPAEDEATSAARRRSSASSARSSGATYERFDWADEVDEWERCYTDDGEPTQKVAAPAPARPVIDYLAWRPPSPPSPPSGDDAATDPDLPDHVLEVYDFPSSFTTQDLTMVFQQFVAGGFDVRWVDDTHALAVFSSAACVAEALLMQHSLVRCRPLSQASARARQKAARCRQAQALLPHRPRPETCALQARRMVFTALGRRDVAPREQREQERKQLQTARDKKRLAAKQKQDAWEGNF